MRKEELESAQKNLKEWAPTEHWNCPIYEHQHSGTGWGSDLLKDSHEKATLAVIRWDSLGQTKGQAALVRLAVTKNIFLGDVYGWVFFLGEVYGWDNTQQYCLCSSSWHSGALDKISAVIPCTRSHLSSGYPMLIYPFGLSSFFLIPFPSLLYPFPDAQRSKIAQSIQS